MVIIILVIQLEDVVVNKKINYAVPRLGAAFLVSWMI